MVRSELGACKRVSLAIALAIVLVMPTPSTAQQPGAARLFRFDIAAKPLPQALNEIGRTTGLAVVFAGSRPFSVTGRQVRGDYTPSQALATLLAGTGITYRFTNPRTVTIDTGEPGSSAGGAVPAGAIALDTIDVQGASNSNSTMSLPPVYAGGQVASGGRAGLLGNRSIFDIPFSQTNYTEQLMRDQQVRRSMMSLKTIPPCEPNRRLTIFSSPHQCAASP